LRICASSLRWNTQRDERFVYTDSFINLWKWPNLSCVLFASCLVAPEWRCLGPCLVETIRGAVGGFHFCGCSLSQDAKALLTFCSACLGHELVLLGLSRGFISPDFGNVFWVANMPANASIQPHSNDGTAIKTDQTRSPRDTKPPIVPFLGKDIGHIQGPVCQGSRERSHIWPEPAGCLKEPCRAWEAFCSAISTRRAVSMTRTWTR
jgi:hypothetical protein